MTTALLVLAQSGRGGDSGDSGDGLLILLGVFIAVAILALMAFWIISSAKARKRGDATREGGEQPPGRVGQL